MPLVVRDGNGINQAMPNVGIDKTVYSTVDATITTSATSATDIYQFVGAAGTVARLKRLEFWPAALISGTTFAGTSTLMQLVRRTAAGTVGAWTQLNTSTTYAKHNAAAAASAITVNVAGNTAFTVGATAGILRRGYLGFPSVAAVTSINNPLAPLVWAPGNDGNYPIDVVGVADFVTVNLNGVTPIATFVATMVWEEASI